MDLSNLKPTSKLSLKLTCLSACRNDVRQAGELYEFIAGDMSLPDVDPEKPDTMTQVKGYARDMFGWLGEHRDELLQGWQILKGLRSGASASTPSDIPPLP